MPPQQEPSAPDLRVGMGLVLIVCDALSAFPAVFLHRVGSWGTRYPVPASLLGAIVAPLLVLTAVGSDLSLPTLGPRTHDAEAFLIMWVVWLIGLFLHKSRASARVISRYDGTPIFGAKGGRDEIAVKRVLEPLLCVGFGGLMHAFGLPAFGTWWVACGIAYALTTALAIQHLNRLAQDQLDAEREAELRQAWADQMRTRR